MAPHDHASTTGAAEYLVAEENKASQRAGSSIATVNHGLAAGSGGHGRSAPATPLNATQSMEMDSIEARFPAYSTGQMPWPGAASAGHDVAQHASVTDPFTMLSPRELETLIANFHLDAEREMISEFSKMSTDQKLVVLFMQQLRFDKQVSLLSADITSLEPRFAHIEKCTGLAWQPSKAQMKLCRSFVRHYLAKPLSSYVSIGNLVRKYIRNNAERMRLRIYREDMTARVTLNHYIDDQCSQLKSAFRKSIFKSCTNKIPLLSFGRNVLNNYHIPIVPEEVPIPVLGTLALLREIADPLSKKKNAKGADTGFWTTVEERLQTLYNGLGNKERVTDAKWLEWAREMIKKDEIKFPVRGAELPPMSRDEISASVGMASAEIPDDEHGFEEPNPDDLDDDDLDIDRIGREGGDQPHSEDDYDGDITLDGMGDIGSTASS
ncbi:hypothetical protein PYCCODRAFT_1463471 [Trametes coccinea BRFM310]|uniref:Uncharacterized protein n=1 Tax=Trametes coccinea (strain BRFM310) TaxID=1353009 RepID=A0A1Y2J185_TRAC3|nr:hypothetical protein PYCCODRAFT_1463471 [Trametes coccinea BRFM310]